MMIKKLEAMCFDPDFNEDEALLCIQNLDINQEFVSTSETLFEIRTIFLESAIVCNNIRMVELLLKNGADPNQSYNNGDKVIWGMQYSDDLHFEIRLKIAQLLLEYGADWSFDLDGDGESLFEYVTWAVFNDFDWYRCRFLILLVAYGAKCDYCTPRIVGEFDKSNMKKYGFRFVPAGNGFTGEIIDENKNVIAYI